MSTEPEIKTDPQRSGDEDAACPKCGGAVEFGYGLMGGGIGPYEFCLADACDYFHKTRVVEEPSDGE